MPVYALFSNEPRKVLIERFLPGDKRLEFLPLNLVDEQLINSAKTGFYATYHILERSENLCISYEIEGGGEKKKGSSAGLAFAMALLEELKHKKLSIAATGNISDGTKNARVLPVELIPEKLASGIAALSANECGIIFYPYENDMEVTEEIRRTAHENGIVFKPVKTLAEAVKALEPKNNNSNEGDKVRRVNPLMFIFLLIVFIYLGGVLALQFIDPCSIPKEIRTITPVIYPWLENTSLGLKVTPPGYEDEIFCLLNQRLLPALKARAWRFEASFSCKSRFLDQKYTYRLIFEEATLDTGHGQKMGLSLGTCKGSGLNLEDAKGKAIDNLWKKLQGLIQKAP